MCPTSDRVDIVFLIFRHWSTKQKIHEHRKSRIWSFDEFHMRFLFLRKSFKMVMPLINSLLTRLLARSIHKLGPYGKMKHCISLFGVSNSISKL